jgi:hypothetical protein
MTMCILSPPAAVLPRDGKTADRKRFPPGQDQEVDTIRRCVSSCPDGFLHRYAVFPRK